jgi:hypothetical protein
MDMPATDREDETRLLLREVSAVWLPREPHTRDIRRRISRCLLQSPPIRPANPYPDQPWRNWVRLSKEGSSDA